MKLTSALGALEPTDSFKDRHIGPNAEEIRKMLEALGFDSLDELIDATVPRGIRSKRELQLGEGLSEFDALAALKTLASQNEVWRTYLGMGYSGCVTPPVIQRNILENPGWYTQYTPYQAEIAQGRLEGLLNFQTMVRDLTGMEVATASLLDEATAAAEAMTMLNRVQGRRIESVVGPAQFFVADSCFPQTIEVLRARAEPLGIELVVGDPSRIGATDRIFGALVQTPDESGRVHDLRDNSDRSGQPEAPERRRDAHRQERVRRVVPRLDDRREPPLA